MFQLMFKGECVPGTDPQTARDGARNLFKASVDQVERMFSGQPVVIRNRLEESQAEKYRAVLYKHGMVAYVQPMAGTKPPGASTSAPAERPPANPPSSGRTENAGSAKPQPADQPSPAAKTGSGAVIEPGDRLPVAGDKVDGILAGSSLSLDPPGVTLEKHQDVEPPMFQHLDEWTLAPPGSDLGVERDLPPPMVPDVSHLSLADEDKPDSP